MPTRDAYAPGTPCWVDLSSDDTDRAVAFYTGLLGWQAQSQAEAEPYGGYRMCHRDGRAVAAITPKQQPGMPSVWTTYISSDDVDRAAAGAAEHGGQVLAEPVDIMTLGRMAVLQDPAGAVFGLWQPGEFPGAELVGEPGALAWNELRAPDPSAVEGFYREVAGMDARDLTMPSGTTYRAWFVAGQDGPVGGVSPLDAPGMPAHWAVTFGVEDVDAAVAGAGEAGAQVVMAPQDFDFGRLAVLQDPEGAFVGLMAG